MEQLEVTETPVAGGFPAQSEPETAGPAGRPWPESHRLVIQPKLGWVPIDWRECWDHRELLYFLVWRDVKVRYKQTVLGLAWAVLQPVLSMVIFTFVFGRVARIPSQEVPYPLFVYAGLLPWTLFSSGANAGALSLMNSQGLLTKVYFPRLFLPFASLGTTLVDTAVSFGVYACLLAIYRTVPGWGLLALPALLALTVVFTLGVSLATSALGVKYRDVRYLVTFGLQILMYLSPVIYPLSLVPQRYQWVMALNPMAGIISGFRWAILGLPCPLWSVVSSVLVSLALFGVGLFYFRSSERRFADLV